jgi:hypothetical protein
VRAGGGGGVGGFFGRELNIMVVDNMERGCIPSPDHGEVRIKIEPQTRPGRSPVKLSC